MSSSDVRTITVTILDKDYQVACPIEAEKALRESADYLDQRMSEIKRAGKVFGLERIAVMTALNLSNELLHSQTPEQKTHKKLKELNEKLDLALYQNQQLKI